MLFKTRTTEEAKKELEGKGIAQQENNNFKEVSFVGGYLVDMLFRCFIVLGILGFLVGYYTNFTYTPMYVTTLELCCILLSGCYFLGVRRGTSKVVALQFSRHIVTVVKIRCSFIEKSEEEKYIAMLKELMNSDDKFVSANALRLLSAVRQYEDDGFIKGQVEYLDYYLNYRPQENISLAVSAVKEIDDEEDLLDLGD